MLKKIVFIVVCLLTTNIVLAREPITVIFNSSPGQPNSATYLRTLEVANQMQDKYEFLFEFKPGASGVLALNTMDNSPNNRLATAGPTFMENAKQKLINADDYVAVTSDGDACWAIITNVGNTDKGIASLKGQKEITIGGTGYGNSAHLIALVIGEQLGFKVRYIVYKANYEALVHMAGGQDINFVLERVSRYQAFKEKNPRLQILGITCNSRSEAMPEIKTMREQGYNAPPVFFATLASVRMPEAKRKELGQILDTAQEQLGAKYFLDTADVFPVIFHRPRRTAQEFFDYRNSQMKDLSRRYEQQIIEAR